MFVCGCKDEIMDLLLKAWNRDDLQYFIYKEPEAARGSQLCNEPSTLSHPSSPHLDAQNPPESCHDARHRVYGEGPH